MARADDVAEEEAESREHLEAVREAADSASAETEQDETVLVEAPMRSEVVSCSRWPSTDGS